MLNKNLTVMDEQNSQVNCSHCGKSWDKRQLERSCSNCFACTGCEAYICPECRYEIVVVPIKPMKRGGKGKGES